MEHAEGREMQGSPAKLLFEQTVELGKNIHRQELKDAWIQSIQKEKASVLVNVVGQLTTDEQKEAANLKALREAIISEIERQNADAIISMMQGFDASAKTLTVASFIAATVTAVLASVQVAQAFHWFRW